MHYALCLSLLDYLFEQITHRDLGLSAVKAEKFEKSHLGLEPTKILSWKIKFREKMENLGQNAIFAVFLMNKKIEQIFLQ